jgi:ATP-binding cassette subfamily F protein uup
MIVSHDRYLLDKLTDQLFIVEEKGRVRIYNGNYSSYRVELEEQKQQERYDKAAPATQVKEVPKNKLSFKEQKELETLEKDIAQLETKLKELNDKLNAGLDNSAVIETSQKVTILNDELDGKTMRWLELNELKG